MKRTGKIQYNYPSTATSKERYPVYKFKGLFQFLKAMWKVYKSDCKKIYVFYD